MTIQTAGGEPAVVETPRELVQAGGVEYLVEPVKVGQVPAFLRAIKPIIQGAANSDGELSMDLFAILADHGDAVVEAVAIALRAKREDLEALDLDEFARLAAAVWRLNQAFFLQRVLPLLAPAQPRAT